jgi:ribosomal protein L24E
MNEIEMAIDAIGIALAQEPPAAIEQGYGFYLVTEDALATALTALREKLERSKGCVWCKEDSKVFHDGQHFHFFCSYCGKRLEEHHEAD